MGDGDPSAGSLGDRLTRGTGQLGDIDQAIRDTHGYLVDVIFFATDTTGSPTLVTTGTVTITEQQWSYSAQPTDYASAARAVSAHHRSPSRAERSAGPVARRPRLWGSRWGRASTGSRLSPALAASQREQFGATS